MLSNEDAVRAFAAGRSGNSKNVFHDDHGRLYSYGHHFILAVRLKGNYLINGDTYSPTTSRHTSLCIEHLKPNIIIPFSALDRVTRDYHLIQIVDREADKHIPRIKIDPKTKELVEYDEHRLGSAVIEINEKYYLSSIDTGAKGRGGYFLAELPEKVSSVEEAFEALFPEGLDPNTPHVRQGEFFFVPTDMKTKDLAPVDVLVDWGFYNYALGAAVPFPRFRTKIEAEERLRLENARGDAFASIGIHRFPIKDQNNLARHFNNIGTGNPHNVREIRCVGDAIFVRGSVRHPQHKIVNLGDTWHRVYVNRAVRSFSASGNVD